MWLFCYLLLVRSPIASIGKTDFLQDLEEFKGAFAVEDGYFLDPLSEPVTNMAYAQFSDGPEVLECPSSNVITTRYKCSVNGEWVDCTRKHCCQDYTFIAGRCVLKDEDPCSMNLCEQQCTVYLQRVICTCFDGYKFSAQNQRNGVKPFCVDVNECVENNGDCEQECINEVGTHRCGCRAGFALGGDNRTCTATADDNRSSADLEEAAVSVGVTPTSGINATELPARRDRCYASCDSVSRLHDKLKVLSEKVSALSTAIRLASFASGPPGPTGPPGPPGHPGPRGFPGPEGDNTGADAADIGGNNGEPGGGGVGGFGGGSSSANNHNHNGGPDYTYSILDAFVPLPGDETTHCRCKRGPQGFAGPPGVTGVQGLPGERGQRGPKGTHASFDFLLLVLAEFRYDIQQIQKRVFSPTDRATKFDVSAALEQQRVKGKQKLLKQYEALVAATGSIAGDEDGDGPRPVMEMTVDFRHQLSNRQMVSMGESSVNADSHPQTEAIPPTSSTTELSSETSDMTDGTGTETAREGSEISTSAAPTSTASPPPTPSNDPTDDYEEDNTSSFSGEMTYEDYL